uniref:Natriuretic peptide receptor 1b n=1 Tax=Gasterosteus aculeatus TaxID=69293 RepID=G3N7D5_GASAC
QNVTLAVILPQSNTDYPWAWPRIGPALERAVQTVNADPALLPGHHLAYVYKNSEDKQGICSESVAALMAVDLKLANDPWAFIGPGCSYTSSPVGLFTTHWDVPMVTAGASAAAFYGGVYPSITNTGPTHKKLGRFALRICQHFGWRQHVMLVFSDDKVDDRPCYFAVEGLYMELQSINITVVNMAFNEKELPMNYSEILANIQNDGRVMFVCCSPDVFRKLMVEFRRADLPHEQYVFFYIDVFGGSLDAGHKRPWDRGDQDDAVAREAFKVPRPFQPLCWVIWSQCCNLLILSSHPICPPSSSLLCVQMNIIAGGFYDGVMLFTRALNETMSVSAGRPPGKVVTKRMWNRTFYG